MALTLTCGSTDVTAYLLDRSLRCTTTCDGSQGTLDFTLVDYVLYPAFPAVTLVDGATTYYSGTIRQGAYREWNGHTYGTFTAQDDAEVDTGTPDAPYDFSYDPDGEDTTYFRDLTVRVESATTKWPDIDTDLVTGTFSTWTAGFAPTQLFTIDVGEATDLGTFLDLVSFRIIKLTTTWPTSSTPLFTIDFCTATLSFPPDLIGMVQWNSA
jgi:hypothetical protein